MEDVIEIISHELRVDAGKYRLYDEAATKQSIILRVLSFLGWDTYNIAEVMPEFVMEGKRVDYALKAGNDNKVFIEVKKIAEDLEKLEHQKQLLEYSFTAGVQLAVLTNGITWYFYLPMQPGSWDQRRYYAVDFLVQPTHAVRGKLINFISKENVISGKAYENARLEHTSQRKTRVLTEVLPRAWDRLLDGDNEIFIEVFSETVEKMCGFKAPPELISEFLRHQKFPIEVKPPKIPAVHKQLVERTYTLPRTSTTLLKSFTFQGQKYECHVWKQMLLKLCVLIYTQKSERFNDILSLVGRKRPYFTRNANELRDPKKIPGTDIYAETNMSAPFIIKKCHEVLSLFSYKPEDFSFEVSE